MSRNTDSAVTSASQLPQLRYRVLCEVHSATGGAVRTCTGDRYIFSGNTYSPVGHLGGFDKIQEDAEPFPRAVRLWFSAVNTSVIQDVINENLHGKPTKMYRCFLTDSYTIAGTAQLAFVGYINTVDLKLADAERGNYFELECESRLRQPAKSRYFNKETHWVSMGYSGDTFFSLVAQIPLVTAPWGNLPAKVSHGTNPVYPITLPGGRVITGAPITRPGPRGG